MIKNDLLKEIEKNNLAEWRIIEEGILRDYDVQQIAQYPIHTIEYFYLKYSKLYFVNAYPTTSNKVVMHIMHPDSNILEYTKGIKIVFVTFWDLIREKYTTHLQAEKFIRDKNGFILQLLEKEDILVNSNNKVYKIPKWLENRKLLKFIFSSPEKGKDYS